jgi:hypothetical protein
MIRYKVLLTFALLCLGISSVFGQRPIYRAGAAYDVDCSKGQTITAALAAITNGAIGGRATLDIHGTCKENVFIINLDRVTLIGHDGATIQDPSNGENPTVAIFDSTVIDLQNLTINGGSDGVDCIDMSGCHLENDIVQNAVVDGLRVARSNAGTSNNTFQNNGDRGVVVVNGAVMLSSQDTVSGNAFAGILVSGSTLTALTDTIQDNGSNGIRAINNATLRIGDMSITGNAANGISIESASTVLFSDGVGSTISGNTGHGMVMLDQTNAAFSGLDQITGNQAQPDLFCNGIYWAATGVDTIGGTTNCVGGNKK